LVMRLILPRKFESRIRLG